MKGLSAGGATHGDDPRFGRTVNVLLILSPRLLHVRTCRELDYRVSGCIWKQEMVNLVQMGTIVIHRKVT